MDALARLLAHEDSASDLLALLIEMDPIPLRSVLDLESAEVVAQREVVASGAGKGRLDLVVRRTSDLLPIAVLEMKGASDLHGDQLERYDAWASDQGISHRFYCTFDGDDGPAPWQSLRLASLFGAWTRSQNIHAAWLAEGITRVLREWHDEANGLIGEATGWYVPDIITRLVARDLDKTLRKAHDDGSEARASRTSGGNPMLMAWRRHPSGAEGVWLAVDVRCQARGAQERDWLFRPCVDVIPSGRSDLDDRVVAHDRAVDLLPALRGEAIREHLVQGGYAHLANALTSTHADGLLHEPGAGVLAQWREGLAYPRRGGRHPVFFHDAGTRLATQFSLRMKNLTRVDLEELCLQVLDHLVASAKLAPSSIGPPGT